MSVKRKTEFLDVDAIRIGASRRPVREEAVLRLMESMRGLGLQTPISVRMLDPDAVSDPELVAGAHRLDAAKRLGWQQIECFVVDHQGDDEARMWEIAENLHRAELTVLERDEHVAEWIKLAEDRAKREAGLISGQSAPKIGRGRPESGIARASRELGVENTDAKRAVKVAGLSDEAKETAREVGLDDNRSALLEAARHGDVEDQIRALRERRDHIARPKVAADPLPDTLASEKQVARLMDAWNAAGPDARAEFMLRIDIPVMDRV